MPNEKSCIIKITSEKETIPLSPFGEKNPTFLTLNKDGTYSITGNETIELLPYTPGEKVFITMSEDMSAASEMTKEQLLEELSKKAYEINRKDAVNTIIERKDAIISQSSNISNLINSRSYGSLENISANLKVFAEILDDFIKFEKEFGSLVSDDDRR